jgi:methylated-DNA-protein-cysteine methyltransferase-like protein
MTPNEVLDMRRKPIEQSAFSLNVIRLIGKIPKGKVATYGQIAALAGKPHGARGVGWILHACAESYDLPWQRVLNVRGTISFPKRSGQYRKQVVLLKRDGVQVSSDGQVDLKRCQWNKCSAKSKQKKRGGPTMFDDAD